LSCTSLTECLFIHALFFVSHGLKGDRIRLMRIAKAQPKG
jgi:hypothetical protein